MIATALRSGRVKRSHQHGVDSQPLPNYTILKVNEQGEMSTKTQYVAGIHDSVYLKQCYNITVRLQRKLKMATFGLDTKPGPF